MRANVPPTSTAHVTPGIDAIATGLAFACLDLVILRPGAMVVALHREGGVDLCHVSVILHEKGDIDVGLLRHGRTKSASYRYIQLWLRWRRL